MVTLFQELARDEGCSIIIVTHDDRILDVADRLVKMEDGQITVNVAVQETREICDLLQQTTLFSDFPTSMLIEIAVKMRGETAEPGQVVIRQGDVGEKFYLIRSGKVDVVIEKNGKTETVAHLVGGQFFGELALEDGRAAQRDDHRPSAERVLHAWQGGLQRRDRAARRSSTSWATTWRRPAAGDGRLRTPHPARRRRSWPSWQSERRIRNLLRSRGSPTPAMGNAACAPRRGFEFSWVMRSRILGVGSGFSVQGSAWEIGTSCERRWGRILDLRLWILDWGGGPKGACRPQGRRGGMSPRVGSER